MTFVSDSILVSLTLEHRDIQTHSFLISQFFWLTSFHVFFLFTSLAVFVGGVWKPEKVLEMCESAEGVWRIWRGVGSCLSVVGMCRCVEVCKGVWSGGDVGGL